MMGGVMGPGAGQTWDGENIILLMGESEAKSWNTPLCRIECPNSSSSGMGFSVSGEGSSEGVVVVGVVVVG